MEEMFEYLVPLQGFFKKKRNPKIIESYKALENFNDIVADFKIAKALLNDAVRIGQQYVFCKNKVTVFCIKDIVKAYFRVHGYDATDEFGTISFLFRDNSEDVIYKSPATDEKIADDIFATLREHGIETVTTK